MPINDHRGQAHTLEALIATTVLVTAVLFALNAVVVTPTASGTIDPDTQSDLRGQFEDALGAAEDTGALTHMVLYVDNASGQFAGDWTSRSGYQTWPDARFTRVNRTLDAIAAEEGLRYNLAVQWEDEQSVEHRRWLTYDGSPSDEAVIATETVVLTDDMRLRAPDGDHPRLDETSQHPVDDVGDGPVYNVVEIRVIAW